MRIFINSSIFLIYGQIGLQYVTSIDSYMLQILNNRIWMLQYLVQNAIEIMKVGEVPVLDSVATVPKARWRNIFELLL